MWATRDGTHCPARYTSASPKYGNTTSSVTAGREMVVAPNTGVTPAGATDAVSQPMAYLMSGLPLTWSWWPVRTSACGVP